MDGDGLAMELTHEDVLQILKLIDQSPFDYLELQTGDLKLVVQKHGGPASAVHSAPTAAPPSASTTSPPVAPTTSPPPASMTGQWTASTTGTSPASATPGDGTVCIVAPMVGQFYVAPEPGARPFVEVGSPVEPDTTVGLIEVMKVFNAVKAGVRGVIVERLVQDGQFVEYGQPLFRVRPQPAPAT